MPRLVQFSDLQQLRDGRAVLLRLLVLGGNGNASGREKLPLVTRGRELPILLPKNLVQVEDGRVNGGLVEVELIDGLIDLMIVDC